MPASAPIEIESWLEAFQPTAQRMQYALQAMIEFVLDGPGRPSDLCEQFNLGGTMAKRVYRAMKSDSATDVALLLPGRPTMMRLIEQAERLCAENPELVTELRGTYKEFFRQVSRIAATHQELTSVLSVHDPRVLRESSERSRASAFRSMTEIAGGHSEAMSVVWVHRPNQDDPSKGDHLTLHGIHGLRRLGIMQSITISTVASENVDEPSRQTKHRIDGHPIGSHGTIVRELSSSNLPALKVIPTQDAIYSIFDGEDLPHGTPIDLVAGSIQKRWVKNIRHGESGTEQASGNFSTPTKLMITDMFIHKDMWPGIEPDFRVYNTLAIPESSYPGDFWFREVPSYDDPIRLISARMLVPIPEAPKHSKMVQYTLDHTGIDLADFRIYRQILRYPVVGHSYWLYFSRRPEELAQD